MSIRVPTNPAICGHEQSFHESRFRLFFGGEVSDDGDGGRDFSSVELALFLEPGFVNQARREGGKGGGS